MINKLKTKTRGIRFPYDQWERIVAMAKEENNKPQTKKITPSEIVRHAVDEMEKAMRT